MKYGILERTKRGAAGVLSAAAVAVAMLLPSGRLDAVEVCYTGSGNDSESAIEALIGMNVDFLAKIDYNEDGSIEEYTGVAGFSATGAPGTGGTWTAPFPILAYSVKAGNGFQVCVLDPAAASGNWTTLPWSQPPANGNGISHISFWGTRGVPEASSMLAVLGGFSLVGLMTRLRRAKAS